MKKWWGIIGILALLTIAFYFASAQFKILTVTGNSMYPAITENDVVVVALSKNDFFNGLNVKEGDVITYTLMIDGKEVLMTHRITEIDRSGTEARIRTKGDNRPEVDNYFVTSSQVVGTVILVIPFLGAFLRFANSFYGLVLLIIIPAILIIATEVRKLIQYKSKRAQQDNDR